MNMRSRDDLRGSGKFFLGVVTGCIFVGCAGLSFPYKYYDPVFVSYDGTLMGPSKEDDLPGNICEPNEESKHPCVIMKAQEFFLLKHDYIDLEERLVECEKPKT